jgi:hypothetical protein
MEAIMFALLAVAAVTALALCLTERPADESSPLLLAEEREWESRRIVALGQSVAELKALVEPLVMQGEDAQREQRFLLEHLRIARAQLDYLVTRAVELSDRRFALSAAELAYSFALTRVYNLPPAVQ